MEVIFINFSVSQTGGGLGTPVSDPVPFLHPSHIFKVLLANAPHRFTPRSCVGSQADQKCLSGVAESGDLSRFGDSWGIRPCGSVCGLGFGVGRQSYHLG